MFLAVAATEIEMSPLQRQLQEDSIPCLTLVTGVGPIETAVRLTRFLAERPGAIKAVVNLGVAGGYISVDESDETALLDLFVAETEVFGDLGISYSDRVVALPEELTGKIAFLMNLDLLTKACRICFEHGMLLKTGNFVTVAGVSATRARGEMLRNRYQAHCENMEGAAVARVSAEYALPVLEVRCISNLVEDRDLSSWRLEEACIKSAQMAAIIIKSLTERP